MAGLNVGGLSADQLDALSRDGFVAIESLLTDEDLTPVYSEYERILDGRVDRLLADGTLSERPGGGFGDRYSAVLAADPLSHRSDQHHHYPVRFTTPRRRSWPDRCGRGRAWSLSDGAWLVADGFGPRPTAESASSA